LCASVGLIKKCFDTVDARYKHEKRGRNICQVGGRHSGDHEGSSLLGCYCVWIGVYWSTATDILVSVGVTIFLNHPEDRSSKTLRNMYDHIQIYTASPEDLYLQFISYIPPSTVPFFWKKFFEVAKGVFVIS